MNKSWFYLGAMSSLAVLMTSCGGDGDKKPATPSPSPSAAASPAPATPTAAAPAAAPAPTASPSPTVATTPPVVPGKNPAIKNVSVDVAAGLIPATEGESWARTVAKGRPDPFAVLALQPIEAALPKDLMGQPAQKQTASNGKNSNSSPSSSSSPSPTAKTPSQPNKIAKNSPAPIKSGVNKPLPDIKVPDAIAAKPDVTSDPEVIAPIKPAKDKVATIDPKPSVKKDAPKVAVGSKPASKTPARKPNVAIKPAPPTVVIKPLTEPIKIAPISIPAKPEAKLAATVGISGVMQVDGKTQVIVKLPNESFSRYVEVGDRIYDGKVRIKRVEGEQSLSPMVVLEESGVEVSRRVGDTPGAAPKEGNKDVTSEVKPSLP
jgi:hypothetical protein